MPPTSPYTGGGAGGHLPDAHRDGSVANSVQEARDKSISNQAKAVERCNPESTERQDGFKAKPTRMEGLRYELLPVTSLEDNIVGWDSQDDPKMPFNFPKWRKWLWVGLLSVITLLTPFASSILSPGIDKLDHEFRNGNAIIGSMTVSIYLLGYVVGPIFIAPLSEIYGRKPILTISNAFFCVWQIGCALAPNIETLIVCRFFSGVGGAACLTLGGSIIGDLFRPDERGFAIGMWNMGPLVGPTIGPLLGGFLTQSIGWRYDFWIVLAAAAPTTALIALLNPETCHKALMHKKTTHLQASLRRDILKSCYADSAKQGTPQMLLTGFIRPLKMLVLSPIIFFLSLYIAFTFGVVYLLYTTIPLVFETIYGLNASQVGLVYLALGPGNILGWLVITLQSDKLVIKLARANNDVFEPEMRLTISIYFGAFLPVTLFWYRWSSYYKLHLASTIISLMPYCQGLGLGSE